MKPLLVLMLAGILLGEYVAPWSENLAQANRALAQGGGEPRPPSAAVHRQGNEFVHINAVQPNGVLYGVTRYEFDGERHMQAASFARRALYQGDHAVGGGDHHALPWRPHREVVEAGSERWDIQLNPQLLSTVVMEPEALSISACGAMCTTWRAGPEQQPLLAGLLDQAACSHW